MSSMENPPNTRKVKSLHSLVQVGPIKGVIEAMEQVLSLVEKARSFHSCKTLATDVEKGDIRKHRTANIGHSVQRLWKEGAL